MVLLGFIGLEMLLGLVMLAPIGVTLLEVLGVVIVALYPPRPLLPLLPREVDDMLEPVVEDEPYGLPARLSEGAVEVFEFREREVKPMPASGLPPPYGRVLFLLQQLHPVNSMPILHAPIKPTKGILPMIVSSPV